MPGTATGRLLVLALACACSGGAPTQNADAAAPVVDATVDTCNLVAQTGCPANRPRCTIHWDFDWPYCAAAGVVGEGGPCVIGSDGLDNCAGALGCADGTCVRFCQQDANTCNTGSCRLRPGWLGGEAGLCDGP